MKALPALFAIVLALAACTAPAPAQDAPPPGVVASTSPPRPEPASPTRAPGGHYKLTTQSGADISLTVPAPATDPAVEAIEAYRAKVGAAPVSYLVADVDNQKGTAPIDMYMVSVFDEQGEQLTFSRVTGVIHSWGPTYSYDFKWTMHDGTPVDEAVGAGLRDEANGLYNANADDAEAGERTRIVLASTNADMPEKVARVTVQPSGMEVEEEAWPVS